jgi:hypothetical protein
MMDVTIPPAPYLENPLFAMPGAYAGCDTL